jgi:branched-chain amino acid transport system permease protein
MKGMATPKSLVLVILGAIYLIFIPLFYHDSNYLLNVIITTSALSLMALGVWLTFTLGLINIGQGAFATIGAYVTAVLSVRYGLPFWLCLPISGLVATFIGVLIGMPILRLKGVYFAMITICLGEAVRLVFMNGGKFTGGPDGIWNVPRPGAISIGGWTIIPAFKATDYLSFYFLAAFLLITGIVVVWRLERSRLGQIFKTIRQSDMLASSVGVNIAKYRIIAFGVACFFGGIGGSFLVSYMTTIYPNSYTVFDSINFILYCFLGGLEYLFGAIVGTFILAGSFEALRFMQKYQALLYALVMIAAIMWLPNGLLSIRLGRKSGKGATDHMPPKSIILKPIE